MKKYFFTIFLLCLMVIPAYAAIENPKSVSEITIAITQSGSLDVSGRIDQANLTIYIPQESSSVIVDGADWKYVYDDFDNKLVLLEWENPVGSVDYSIETVVKNSAKHIFSEKDIGNDDFYLQETSAIEFSPEIREIAYPYEQSLENVAYLTEYVNDLLTYDKSLVGKRKSSTWALENKRGVCVEYANVLTSLLRVSGIPTRYVVGFAYSPEDNKLIGHTWVEVFADKWIPFDPTWLQGGYIDATHIKTANLLDDDQKNRLSYRGTGRIDWTVNEEQFDIIDYKEKNIADIASDDREASLNGYGFIHSTVSVDECTIIDLNINSCTDNNNPLLDIYDRRRTFWTCDKENIFWVFGHRDLGSSVTYTCPVGIYTQTGSRKTTSVRLAGRKDPISISIEGPDIVAVNEPFELKPHTNREYILFSPDFGRYKHSSSVSIGRSGNFTYYLFSDGSLTDKTIEVLREKAFTLSVDIPVNATIGNTFLVSADVKNTLSQNEQATIRLEYMDKILEDKISFSSKQEKEVIYNLTAATLGLNKITVSVLSDSISTYSGSIYVYEKKSSSFIDAIIAFFQNLLKLIIGG